ncbi:MAG: DNA polymerase III subunit epsilon [Methylococcus sp.]|jgi:DNA polymerase-3 subunit epsilon|nr:MAG: DNA polymerase III subunit epsilon [Methylococcus sp.]
MKQIVLDTETTGLSPEDGHRIIEIGCVELLKRKATDNRFHVYLNPDREIDRGATEVHGISNEFLADKPRFEDVVDDLVAYLSDAELIIHNAPFDIGFLNHELRLSGRSEKIEQYCLVTDTLALARKKHPGQRNSLDALCKRYVIDNSHRDLHGALLDAEILAEVYLMMTGGQTSMLAEDNPVAGLAADGAIKRLPKHRPELKVIRCSESELKFHNEYLKKINNDSDGQCLWLGEQKD